MFHLQFWRKYPKFDQSFDQKHISDRYLMIIRLLSILSRCLKLLFSDIDIPIQKYFKVKAIFSINIPIQNYLWNQRTRPSKILDQSGTELDLKIYYQYHDLDLHQLIHLVTKLIRLNQDLCLDLESILQINQKSTVLC